MKILKLKLYQENVCYRKPFSFKVAETYPLPPYSTVIGMLHNILDAKNGETYKFDISIQGTYASVCHDNYMWARKFLNNVEKKKYDNADAIRKPLKFTELVDVNLILHIKAENEIIDKIYNNIINGQKSIILGRNYDIARVDYVGIVDCKETIKEGTLANTAYIKPENVKEIKNDAKKAFKPGITFHLNTYYTIKNDLRYFDKVNVLYCEKNTKVINCEIDNENDFIFFV